MGNSKGVYRPGARLVAVTAAALLAALVLALAGAEGAEAGKVGIAKSQTKQRIVSDGARVVKNSCRKLGRGGKNGVKCRWVSARLLDGKTTRNCKGIGLLKPKRKRIKFQTSRCNTDNGATSVNGLMPAKLLDRGFESTYVFCFTTLGDGYRCVWEGLRHKPGAIEACKGTARNANRRFTIKVKRCSEDSVASGAQAAVKLLLSGQGLTPGLIACRPGATISCSWDASRSSAGWTYSCEGTATAATELGPFSLSRCDLSAPDLAPLTPKAGPHPDFGVNELWATARGQIGSLADDFGAETARFVVNWNGVQPQAGGAYDFRQADDIYARMQRHGIDPVLIIQAAPCWATGDPACTADNYTFPPDAAHVGAWGAFAAAVARRYPNAMAIEVWNEANARLFFHGGPRPAQYASLLREAYTSIKAARPSMPVITTGTAAFASTGSGQQRYDEFLRDVYEALGPGARRYSDGIGHHAYPGGGPSADIETGIRGQIADLKNVMLDFGDQDKPIWITETGVSTAGRYPYSEKQQARAYAKIYRQFRRIPGIPVVITHRWRNEVGGSANAETGFGLIRANGAKKPVYCSLAAARGYPQPAGACG